MLRANLTRECELAAARARSLRIRDFRYALQGGVVTLDGEAQTPEAIDSAGKLFAGTAAREVRNRIRHAPPDPRHPGAIRSPEGYVRVVEMGPNGSRLAESNVWEVRTGDTLESIAGQFYGKREKAAAIRQANADQIGPDGHVHAGQKLKIPPA